MATLKQIMAEHSDPDLFRDLQQIEKNQIMPEEKAHMAAIVDEAGELDVEIKAMQARLKELKDEIKSMAEKTGQTVLAGDAYTASISGTTNTWVPVKSAWDFVRENGLNVDAVFSVKAGELKKMVGETGMDAIGARTEKIKYHAVSFK